jgi:uncharacterized protein YhbP (UPF0306 family)
MDVRELIKAYLRQATMMQVATVHGNKPWCSTMFFAFDEKWNLYWISKPTTKHSQHIEENLHVAGTIVMQQDSRSSATIRGLQYEGTAEMLNGDEEAMGAECYRSRFGREATFLEDIRSGNNPHKIYRIQPVKFVLCDRLNFPDAEIQELLLD